MASVQREIYAPRQKRCDGCNKLINYTASDIETIYLRSTDIVGTPVVTCPSCGSEIKVPSW